jgi:preprotein translocase subunit SecD
VSRTTRNLVCVLCLFAIGVSASCHQAPTARLITRASIEKLALDERRLSVALREQDRDALAKLTHTHVGRQLEVRIEGVLVMAPTIREPILGGRLEVSWNDASIGQQLERLLTRGSDTELTLEVVE